ncbi:hypothetical protein BCR37DRAFT_391840 [Protomyces lactucae-debilis]|uniref:COP9 signalosome complex subunit 3 N-terminal helical repeats domain-containing protein n=1 Tax=Protomyces lactucae-debilis TaxID=2754530 RepID=A0A1Y2FKX8_PROLT|nr:uncharacterized protein BCR37DRAFT_391840 [Protomyces lactucae-debilis]ORY84237.1 hypothetical protein BCR37DRAFT_391840 [Protomyces lactucae-debilis]
MTGPNKTEALLVDLHSQTRASASPETLTAVAHFLASIDPEEVSAEHASKLLDLLDLISALDDHVAVLEIFRRMLERYPPQVLSPAHVYFVRQCCVARQYDAAMDLAYRSIEHIPKDCGLTYRAPLQYHYYLGMCCAALQHFDRAGYLFSLVVSSPSVLPQQRKSKIQVDAYKKFLLMGLLQDGRLPEMPKMTLGGVRMALEVLGATYTEIGRAMIEAQVTLPALLEQHKQEITNDGNSSLIKSAILCMPTHRILQVQRTHLSLTLTKLASRVGETVEQTRFLLQWMQSTGRIRVEVANGDDGQENVTFLPLKSESSNLVQIQELVLSVKLLTDKVQDKQLQVDLDPKLHQRNKRLAGGKGAHMHSPLDAMHGQETGVNA